MFSIWFDETEITKPLGVVSYIKITMTVIRIRIFCWKNYSDFTFNPCNFVPWKFVTLNFNQEAIWRPKSFKSSSISLFCLWKFFAMTINCNLIDGMSLGYCEKINYVFLGVWEFLGRQAMDNFRFWWYGIVWKGLGIYFTIFLILFCLGQRWTHFNIYILLQYILIWVFD